MSAPTGPRGPQVKEAKMWVKRSLPDGTVEEDNGTIEVRVFETIPANVQAKMKKTINLGNYESVSLEVGVAYPCYAEEVDDGTAMDYVTQLVGGFLLREAEEARKAFLGE